MIFHRTLLLSMVLNLWVPGELQAQKPVIPLSPNLKAKQPAYFSDSLNGMKYLLLVKEESINQQLPDGFAIAYRNHGIMMVRCTPSYLLKNLGLIKGLLYVDEHADPVTEGAILNYDMSVNRVNAVWHQFPLLTGSGKVVSVKEDRMDTSDLDLLGRNIPSPVASPGGSTHATVMTTLIAGAGNSSYTGRGVASQANYSASDFSIVLPDTSSYYLQSGIGVQNHSYGVGIQNYYGINARAFDLSQNANNLLQHVFSAGNSGTSTSIVGPYAGIASFANITGNMKMAKNVLVVGAVDSAAKTVAPSSRGPAYDGRIKPELVAYGDDGSSGAAAIVSGTSILLQQAFQQYNQVNPDAWLLRSILLNSADDAGMPGPDFESGFGLLNALSAVQTVRDNRIFSGEALQGEIKDYIIEVPSSAVNLKISLSWNDTAAEAGAAKALVNDIDLELIHENSGNAWLPWVLNIYPSADSLRKPAVRSVDTLNNNEQVTLGNPLPGRYIIRIKGRDIRSARQAFAIAYQWDNTNTFTWNHPMQNDPVQSGSRIFARWKAVVPAGTRGLLEWTDDSGATWNLISDTVLLEKNQYEISIPDTLSKAKFRMISSAGSFESDEFFISPSLEIKFGFICDTSMQAFWEKVPSATHYRVYQLNGNNMTAKLNTADTSVIFSKSGSTWFSVAPVSGSREGFRGPAINYLLQGTGCYINNFLADLVNDNNARLQLDIGADYNLKKVQILKLSRSNEIIFNEDKPAAVLYSATDMKLEQGLNQYQAVLTLEDGTLIYSGIETVYYLNNKSHLVYPNPVRQGGTIFLLSEFPVEGDVVIYDVWGRRMLQFAIQEKQQEINVSRLNKGTYYIMIYQMGKLISRLPFIVQ